MRSQRVIEQPNRLSIGGLIDRHRPLTFQFDGNSYGGYAGDTLASALLAAGVKLIGRSFKYHRPRGIVTAGSEEPNGLVELRTGARREANTPATMIELFAGLQAHSQNRWPSLAFDVAAINSLFSPLLVSGFYYKTFMWPAALWEKVYEPLIRRSAGLGRPNLQADPDTYEKAHLFCDVLVIGGGAAGLSAALAAGRSGARVVICDEDFMLGGRLNADRREIDAIAGVDWVRCVEAELASLPETRVLKRTTVFGSFDGDTFGAVERVADHLCWSARHQPRQRLWRIVAKRTILASGAIERPLVFGGNDRPGVMMASAVRTYVNRFGVNPGRRFVLFTSSDDGWRTAADLVAAGIVVQSIVDTRTDVSASLRRTAERAGSDVCLGGRIIETRGRRALRLVMVRDAAGNLQRIAADTVAVSGGWNPNIALATHLGGRPRWRDDICAFVPRDDSTNMAVIGAARGSFRLADALREGTLAGIAAAQATGHRALGESSPHADDELSASSACWHVTESKGKAFVDFQNDVTRDDIELAAREGFRSVELLKRYTTLGMGTDQGKTANVNALAILAHDTGQSIIDTGITTFRPPYVPIALGVLAGVHRGKDFRPTRRTPGHRWAAGRGATFVDAGQWLRAQWFSLPGESDWLETVRREARTVRSSVGVCDVSTLGKIDVQGPDAPAFLDRIYANAFSTLPVGKVRYGLMLREDGFAMDDGTCARLAPDHYLMSTTTAQAATVLQHLEHASQVLWPELDVQLVAVTDQWAQYAIAGPYSRLLLEHLLDGELDVSNETFPYLACARFSWRGVNARLFRISFSGELGYELAVPARYGDSTIRAIMAAGAAWGVVPYGTEALGVMRIEKGHVGGGELNGATTAADLGLGRMMSSKKDYIGRVLAARPALADPDRPSLVGIKPVNANARLYAGSLLLSAKAGPSPAHYQEHLTSVAFSAALGHWIGLGFLSRGRSRFGERIRAYDPLQGGDLDVEVGSPVFIDPEGTRLRA